MSSKPNPLIRIVFWALALGLIIHSVTRGNFWAEIDAQNRPFYTELQPGWITLSSNEVKQTLELGDGGDWNILTARTMMNRWRLQGLSEKPWENLMTQYDSGLWISAPSEELEALFQAADESWLLRRNQALADSGNFEPIPFTTTNVDSSTVGLQLITPTPTHNIGSKLVLVFQCDEPFINGSPPLYWQTNKGGRSPLRRRLGLAPKLISPAGERPLVYQVEYDFSWHPDWLAEGIELIQLDLTIPVEGANFTVLRLIGSDSELLRPAETKPTAND
ncbi:MAG: hypothetical protein ACFCU1_02930 [Sumerlaeia bacterium]